MNRLFILTGATGGIGSAVLSFLSEEDAVCCLSRRVIDSVINIRADFSSADDSYIDELKHWIECYETISEIVLILAASTITPIEAIGSIHNSIDDNIRVNVTSQVMVVDAVVDMAKKKNVDVRIIQFDSGAAYRPIKGWAFYCSSKAYMSMFLGVLASENSNYKIVRVDPGVVDTGMQLSIRDSSSEAFSDRQVFVSYKENGQLNDPYAVARFVFDRYLSDWKATALNERFSDFKSMM